jgi:hypothetical protein
VSLAHLTRLPVQCVTIWVVASGMAWDTHGTLWQLGGWLIGFSLLMENKESANYTNFR